MVTPLTTIISRLMEAQSVDAASAESQVKAAFALDETVSLTTFDPVAGALSDNPVISEQGVDIAATGVIVQNLVVQASSAIAAATDTVDVNSASLAVFAALADQINTLQANEELPVTAETVGRLCPQPRQLSLLLQLQRPHALLALAQLLFPRLATLHLAGSPLFRSPAPLHRALQLLLKPHDLVRRLRSTQQKK